MYACIRTHMHACTRTCIHIYIQTYIHAYTHIYTIMHTHTYIQSYIRTHTHTHTHTNKHKNTNTRTDTDTLTHIHTHHHWTTDLPLHSSTYSSPASGPWCPSHHTAGDPKNAHTSSAKRTLLHLCIRTRHATHASVTWSKLISAKFPANWMDTWLSRHHIFAASSVSLVQTRYRTWWTCTSIPAQQYLPARGTKGSVLSPCCRGSSVQTAEGFRVCLSGQRYRVRSHAHTHACMHARTHAHPHTCTHAHMHARTAAISNRILSGPKLYVGLAVHANGEVNFLLVLRPFHTRP